MFTHYYEDRMKKGDKKVLACAIDTEGCIFLGKQKHKDSKRGWIIQQQISIKNTSKKWLEEIAKIIPFNVNVLKVSTGEGRKEAFNIGIRAQNKCEKILGEILPYLTIRQEKGKKVLNYLRNREKNKPYTQEELNLIEEMYNEERI